MEQLKVLPTRLATDALLLFFLFLLMTLLCV
jgi:hypothetical protein